MDPMEITSSSDGVAMSLHDHSKAPLLAMPIEILLHISSHLTTTDLFSLRLTCRGIEQAIFSDFADEFFSRKQFMACEFSLNGLIDMAKSRLGWRMKHIHFGLDNILGAESVPTNDGIRQRRRQEYRAESVSLWSTGWINDLLTEAFSHLSSLESVVIRDFDSTRRHRDGPNKAWTSYGAATVLRNCGLELGSSPRRAHPDNACETTRLVNKLWAAVVSSLGRANARPKSLKIYERSGNLLLDTAFHLPSALAGHVLPVLANLKELHLCIRTNSRSSNLSASNNHLLRTFLTHTSNLEELRINSCVDSCLDMRRFHLWLAASPLSSALTLDPHDAASGFFRRDPWALHPPPVALSHLRTLSLGVMMVNPFDIVAMATKLSPTLRRLELWKVRLNVWHGHLSPDTSLCLWHYLFKRLLGIPSLNLSEIMVGRPSQEKQPSSRQLRGCSKVLFIQQDDPDNIVEPLEYKGTQWREWMTGLSMIFDEHRVNFNHTRHLILRQYNMNEIEAERSDEMQKLKGWLGERISRVREGCPDFSSSLPYRDD